MGTTAFHVRRPKLVSEHLRASALLAAAFIVGAWYVLKYTPVYLRLDPSKFGSLTLVHGTFLFVHVAAGIVALLAGPFQLSSGLRRKTLGVHRVLGRVYLCAVAVGGVAAAYILTLPGASLNFRLGIAGLTIAWLGTTGLAYVAILRRRFALHQEWMIRSYVVTFGFVVFRVIFEVLLAWKVAPPREVIAAASWGCWAFPLLVTEFVLQGRKVFEPDAGTRGLAGTPQSDAALSFAGSTMSDDTITTDGYASPRGEHP